MTKEELGAWLRGCRNATGKSQTKIAREMRISTANLIVEYEMGRRKVPSHRMMAYATAIEADLELLAKRTLEVWQPELFSALYSEERANG